MNTTKNNLAQVAVLLTIAALGLAVIAHTIANGITW